VCVCVCVFVCMYVCMCTVLVPQQTVAISQHNFQFSNASSLCSLSGMKGIAFSPKIVKW
jgi:hypothetical protein